MLSILLLVWSFHSYLKLSWPVHIWLQCYLVGWGNSWLIHGENLRQPKVKKEKWKGRGGKREGKGRGREREGEGQREKENRNTSAPPIVLSHVIYDICSVLYTCIWVLITLEMTMCKRTLFSTSYFNSSIRLVTCFAYLQGGMLLKWITELVN